jgi:hypothetical protein
LVDLSCSINRRSGWAAASDDVSLPLLLLELWLGVELADAAGADCLSDGADVFAALTLTDTSGATVDPEDTSDAAALAAGDTAGVCG